MRVDRAAIFVCVLLGLLADGARAVDASANVRDAIVPPAPPSGPLEQTPLKLTRGGGAAAATTTQQATPAPKASKAWDFARIPIALGAVILLILGLRWVGKRLTGAGSGKGNERGVKVLSRSVLAPRQQMLVVQFGRRLLLVGSSGAEMTPLCQLDDPDEVAEVLAQLKSDGGGAARSFLAAIRGADSAYDQAEETPAAPQPSAPAEGALEEPPSREDLSGLMARVRRISEQFQRST